MWRMLENEKGNWWFEENNENLKLDYTCAEEDSTKFNN